MNLLCASTRGLLKCGFVRSTAVTLTPIEWYQFKFTTTDPDCHGNEIWGKIGLTRLVEETHLKSLRLEGVFVVWLLNSLISEKFYYDRPLLPRQRNMRKTAIARLIYEVLRRSLRLTKGFQGRAIEWCLTNSTTADTCCHDNEIWDKLGYNYLEER